MRKYIIDICRTLIGKLISGSVDEFVGPPCGQECHIDYITNNSYSQCDFTIGEYRCSRIEGHDDRHVVCDHVQHSIVVWK